jgi:hypothetical protein
LDLRAEGKSIFAIRYEGGGKPVLNVSDRAVPLSPGADGISLVRLWMDGSVLEVFVDRKEAVTARCYEPSRGDIEVAWTGEKDALKTLQVWGMEPISHDRLTS